MNKSSFERKLFEFITTEENFESAFEIQQKLPEIINNLKNEFWQLVADKLQTKCKGTDWLSQAHFESDEVRLFLAEWEDNIGDKGFKFYIAFECIYDKLEFDIWIDEYERKRKFDRDRINAYIAKEGLYEKFEGEDNWLVSKSDYNFNELYTLKRTLPKRREEFANELVEKLFDLAEYSKEHLVRMGKMVRK